MSASGSQLAPRILSSATASRFANTASAVGKAASSCAAVFAPTPVARDMGYFEEEGLEVTTVFDNDRANVMPGLEIGDNPTSQREMKLIQGAFNQWHEESSLPLSHISRICACSL